MIFFTKTSKKIIIILKGKALKVNLGVHVYGQLKTRHRRCRIIMGKLGKYSVQSRPPVSMELGCNNQVVGFPVILKLK